MKIHSLRLHPGQDLKLELKRFAKAQDIRAGSIVTCVGSLTHAKLRLADDMPVVEFDRGFEIVSLVGTVSAQGNHLHIAIADSEGTVVGGHLMDNCIIHTTAEIVILEDETVEYRREVDHQTGFDELVIDKR